MDEPADARLSGREGPAAAAGTPPPALRGQLVPPVAAGTPRGALLARLAAFALLGLLAFPPLPTGPLIFVALVPYIDAVRLVEEASARGRRAGRRAQGWLYLGGVLFFVLLFHWLVLVPPEEITVPGLMIPATLLAGLYLGLYPLLAQALARRARRLAGLPLWLGVPIAWVATEYLRTQTQLGCPWGLLSYALTSTPVLLQLAAWIGVFGVSLIVALVNGLIYAAWRQPARRRRFAGAAVALLALLAVQGTVAMRTAAPASTLEVALIQGNIGRKIKFKPELRAANLRRMIELSERAIAAGRAGGAALPDSLGVGAAAAVPDLIVWPETAAPCYFHQELRCRLLVQSFVDRSGVPLFTGFPDVQFLDAERRAMLKWNAAALFLPGRGLVGQYNKVNLVPFGEAMPYQEKVPLLRRIDFGEADFTRGAGFEPLRFPPADFGAMICFESIFPAAGRQAARRGAAFFVNITNDEWFGKSAGPYQHAAMAVGRAIECRRGLARCANTGVSFVVDRYGRVGPTTPLFESRIVHGRVELGSGATPYMVIGDRVPQLALAMMLLLAAAGGWRPRRRRRGPADGSPAVADAPPARGPSRRAWLGVLGLCLGLRLLLFLASQPWEPEREASAVLRADALGYHRLALTLLTCERLAPACDAPLETIRTPLYPLLIAGVYRAGGVHPWAVLLVQLGLQGLACWLLGSTVARILEARLGWLCALLFAIDPFLILYTNTLLSESLFLLLLVASFAACARALAAATRGAQLRAAAASGLALGFAALVRPVSQYLPFVVVALLLVAGRRRPRRALAGALVVVLCYGAVVAPWLARNRRAFGHASLSTVSAFVLLLLDVGPMEMARRGVDTPTVRRQLVAEADALLRADGLDPAADPFVRAAAWKRLAWQLIAAHPGRFALATARGVVHSFANLATSDFARLLGAPPRPAELKEQGTLGGALRAFVREKGKTGFGLAALILPYLLLTGAATALGLAGGWWRRRGRLLLGGALLVAIYFVAVTGAAGLVRYRLPALPFYLPFTAIGLRCASDWWRGRRTRRRYAADVLS